MALDGSYRAALAGAGVRPGPRRWARRPVPALLVAVLSLVVACHQTAKSSPSSDSTAGTAGAGGTSSASVGGSGATGGQAEGDGSGGVGGVGGVAEGGADGVGGTLATVGAGGSAGAPGDCICPQAPPVGGSTCPPECLGSVCTYDDCSGEGFVEASCAGDWFLLESTCGDIGCGPPDSSTLLCGPGFVCMEFGTDTVSYECRPHDCGTGPITCDCVSQECPGECANVIPKVFSCTN